VEPNPRLLRYGEEGYSGSFTHFDGRTALRVMAASAFLAGLLWPVRLIVGRHGLDPDLAGLAHGRRSITRCDYIYLEKVGHGGKTEVGVLRTPQPRHSGYGLMRCSNLPVRTSVVKIPELDLKGPARDVQVLVVGMECLIVIAQNIGAVTDLKITGTIDHSFELQ